MKFKYLIIIIAIVSLVLLYALSFFSQPTVISLATVSSYNGKQVVVTGVVTDYRTTTFGSQIITIIDNQDNGSSPLILYIEGSLFVEYGDLVQATGTVQEYNSEWEIAVNNPRSVTIVQKWRNISFPLWQLAQYPQRYENTNVNVQGIVEKTYKTYFFLTDPDGKYSVVVYDSTSTTNFSKGDTVAVGARFVYEQENLRYVLKISEPTHFVHKQEE
ncbi:MAG: hypothetical protein EHM79_20635 [Geobacter sp.]|nr:MAG: hypothetical protein EHM79_20635 [Geobacter sp.]